MHVFLLTQQKTHILTVQMEDLLISEISWSKVHLVKNFFFSRNRSPVGHVFHETDGMPETKMLLAVYGTV